MTTDKTKRFFRVSAEDFKKIPGSPIAYWMSSSILDLFSQNKTLGDSIESRCGMNTGDNETFLRQWFEISFFKIGKNFSSIEDFFSSRCLYVPYNKGGSFRKWYGNLDYVLKFDKPHYSTLLIQGNHLPSRQFYFLENITWSDVTSAINGVSFRYVSQGTVFDGAAAVCFPNNDILLPLLGFLNNVFVKKASFILNPTLHFKLNDFEKLPALFSFQNNNHDVIKQCIKLSCQDWDSYETSWDFQENPLWKERKKGHWVSVVPICQYYQDLRRHWAEQTEEMQTLERCNNNIFIQAYGLQDELSAEVPWDEITLTCNPWYRYGKRPQPESSQETLYQSFECLPEGVKLYQPVSSQSGYCGFPYSQALEERLLADTMKEFISYAVGCMMGRYSLEKPGLILANQGEDFDDYIAKVRTGTEKQNEQETVRSGFLPDRDGVLPILDDEWFVDDIVAQFKDFLKFTFGEEAFSRNLAFIEKAIGKDIRKYFMKDFYKEHVQRYKKRPIYWLFSSPKGSFNALIYLHRYRPDTVSIVLNDYLREFMTKLRVQRNHLIDDNNRADLSASEKSANLKRIDKYAAMLAELEDYERDILFPLAQKQLAIDLDDGVKVNYLKFGAALKEIPGLKAREE